MAQKLKGGRKRPSKKAQLKSDRKRGYRWYDLEAARKTNPIDMPPHRDRNVERAVRLADAKIRDENPNIEVSKDAAARAFQVRLQAAMDEKGWNQSELARQCERITRRKFGRDRVHTYLKAEEAHTPRADAVAILARALGIDKELLYPTRERLVTGTDRRSLMSAVTDRGDGTAWLRVNQAVPWGTAIKVLEILKGQDEHGVSEHK